MSSFESLGRLNNLPLFSLGFGSRSSLIVFLGAGALSCGGEEANPESEESGAGASASAPDSFGELNEAAQVEAVPAAGEDLGFASLGVTEVQLPGGLANAREVYQVAHYIGRTDGEQNEQNIDIPMRSYVASCNTETDDPRLFVSVSLDQGEGTTVGSVYELAYDEATGAFAPTSNAAILSNCYESHGIAVSDDCSRVGVLCNMPYRAHESFEALTDDLIEKWGSEWMKWENNHDEVDANVEDPEERENKYKEQDQIWLLEWNDQELSEVPDSYVVHKTHGGTHLGAQELLYVDQGEGVYGFSVTARVFDPGGGSHYSAGLTIVDREGFQLNPEPQSGDYRERGWHWACGDGHVLNIRSFYNPETELFGAICTSDWNDWIGNTHGQLGTVAIKMETSSTISEGRAQYFVPSMSSMTSNGGGHTVVPVDADTNLSIIVAPKKIADADMDRFLEDEIGVDPSSEGPFDQHCSDWDENNCYFTYMTWEYWEEDGKYQTVERNGIMDGPELTSAELTRIGIASVDATSGSIDGEAYRWIASDDDCQLSDPQLVPLGNGRYMFGYAKFQCISEGDSYNRVFSDRGAKRMLIPKEFFVAEIDAEGNILEGPVSIGSHGWGGLDEPVAFGDGRVAWTYIPEATFDGYGGGQRNEWEVMVYESKVTD